MIYIVFSLITIAAMIYLTAAASKNKKKIKKYRLINTVIGAVGVLTVFVSYLIGFFLIRNERSNPDFASWAGDMFTVYFRLSGMVFLVLFCAFALSSLLSLTEKKDGHGFFRKIRIMTPIAISALLLLITYFYAPTTANETVALNALVYFAGFGEALAMRFAYTLEYTLEIRKKKSKN